MNKLTDKISKISINANESILSALKKMDELDRKLLIVFENEKFFGLISIGDIQRAIIHNIPLDKEIKIILRKNIKIASINEDFELIKKRMFELRMECMPVLDSEGTLTEVIFWEDIFPQNKRIKTNIDLPVVIMAGGKGSRLRPITNILPKPLIPLDDKTILEHIMDRFVDVGCENFYMSVNYKHEIIKYYFDTLQRKKYNIIYFREEKPLGTAGSLFLLKDKISSTFFVSNCDIVIQQDYSEVYDFHKKNDNELTVVAAMKHINIPYGTIETSDNGRLTGFKEKPDLTFKINSGLYILEPHLLNEIPENEFFHITELIDKIVLRNGRVGVFPVSEGSWTDIGEWNEYLKQCKY